MISQRDPSDALRPTNAFRRATNPRRLIAQWEAVAALLLANPPIPETPIGIVRTLPIWLRWKAHPVGALIAAAARYPRRTAIIDDEGKVTFAEMERRSSALARAWQALGIGPDDTVGLLVRDGRLFFDASTATQKLGASLVYLNGAFSAPQVASVMAHEGIDVLVHDDELAGAAIEARPRIVITEADLRRDVASEDDAPVAAPARPGRIVVLTSGTTGHPKGAVRRGTGSPMDGAAVLASLPVISGDPTVIAAPLFHGFGLFGANLALALGSPIVLRRRFDPEQTLADLAENRAAALVAVPVMLQRMVALPKRITDCYDVSSLRVVLCGGAALSAELGTAFMDRFGDVLYNVYGSTESGFATVASPADLRSAPGTAGRATPGVVVRIADAAGRPMSPGESGRVLVGSGLRMEEYTGGGGKEIVDDLVVTGDLGHVDGSGRLFIDGREDDMIISGGENVFPQEVEEVLAAHPAVSEAAVIGVPDVEFGQRLSAYVVPTPGATVGADELKAYVHERLARFKTPREIVFVAQLPRTATGKVIRRELEAATSSQTQATNGEH